MKCVLAVTINQTCYETKAEGQALPILDSQCTSCRSYCFYRMVPSLPRVVRHLLKHFIAWILAVRSLIHTCPIAACKLQSNDLLSTFSTSYCHFAINQINQAAHLKNQGVPLIFVRLFFFFSLKAHHHYQWETIDQHHWKELLNV